MRLTIVQLAMFASRWRKLRLTDEDLQFLELVLLDDPHAGAVMRGTGGLRKVRFAPPSWARGKSGALRVCYVYFAAIDAVYLITLFEKSEKANLTPAERNAFRRLISELEEISRRSGR